MKKTRMVFFSDYAMSGTKEYTKEELFELIENKRLEAIKAKKKISIYRTFNQDYNRYILKMNGETIEIVLPTSFYTENLRYMAILDSWYEVNKRQRHAKITLSVLVAASIATVIYKTKPELDQIMGEVKAFAEDTIDDAQDFIEDTSNNIQSFIGTAIDNTKYYFGNFGEIQSINALNEELLAHSGHGRVEGYIQTVEEHNNSFCYFGGNVDTSEVHEKIYEYCNKKGLGEDVALSACKRFDLLYRDQMYEASKIDLLDIYKEIDESNQKVNTLK